MHENFSSLVCRGKIRAAIRYTYKRNKSSILILDNIDAKSSSLVLETLADKHLDGCDINVVNLLNFNNYTDFINISIIENNVEAIVKNYLVLQSLLD